MTINWLQPYCPDRNIGREYNRLIDLMPAGSWIGITDHDAMFLRPDSKKQISDIVAKHGDKYDVFGVITNRLFGPHQRYGGVFSDNPDINYHLRVANRCHNLEYGRVVRTTINIAGLCMVFNKDTWERVGGFNENSMFLDKQFTDAVMATGGRLGIMKGVYVFHLYRWGQKEPWRYVEHLRPDGCTK